MRTFVSKVKYFLKINGIQNENVLHNYLLLSNAEKARILSKIDDPKRLEQYGYKVFSQNEEDGIIHEIFKRIGVETKTFIEIGVGSGLENNTYYLLFQGWSGAWIEAGKKNLKKINKNFDHYLSKGNLVLLDRYVKRENIVQILESLQTPKSIDLFSLDIDGNDYYVLESFLTHKMSPRVIVLEYNAKIPADISWVMPYNPAHWWNGSDNFGASLLSFTNLLETYDYQLVGTNITGSNAFYVKRELAKDLFSEPSVENLFNPARYHLTPSFVCGHPATTALER